MRALVYSTAGVVGLGLAFAAASCGSKRGDAAPSPDGGVATDDGSVGGGDDAGADAAPTGPVVPNDIKHIVVVLKENRTFDNYFTGFPGADTMTTAKLSTGQTITRPQAPDAGTTCLIDHTYAHAVDAYDKGKMDRFDVGVYSCPGGDNRPFWAFAESQIPNYWQYARNFAISDRFFSTVNSESTPGHLALVMAQSPAYENPNGCLTPIECGCIAPQNATIATFDPASCATSTAAPCFDVPSIVDALPKGYTWMSYGQGKGTASESTFNFVKSIGTDATARAAHYRDLDQFTADMGSAAQANLVFAFVGSSPISEGPPDDPCAGESYTVTAVNKIMQSNIWNDSIVIVTWDDWGGNYDHVVPPVEACANGAAFYGGFRLPILLISPFAKKGTVAHTPTEQASIPKLIEELWGMPRMAARDPHARDAKAGSLLEAFDFTQAPAAPLVLTPRTCN
jgi:phospholipase C